MADKLKQFLADKIQSKVMELEGLAEPGLIENIEVHRVTSLGVILRVKQAQSYGQGLTRYFPVKLSEML